MERWDLMRNIDTKMDFSSISILTLLVLFLSPMLLAFGNIGTICVFVCILSLLLFSLVIKKDFLDKATQKQYNNINLSFYMYIKWLFIAMIWSGIDFIVYSTILDQSRMIRKTTIVALHLMSRMEAKILLLLYMTY